MPINTKENANAGLLPFNKYLKLNKYSNMSLLYFTCTTRVRSSKSYRIRYRVYLIRYATSGIREDEKLSDQWQERRSSCGIREAATLYNEAAPQRFFSIAKKDGNVTDWKWEGLRTSIDGLSHGI